VLVSLHLTNFRGFEEHEIPLRKLTVIVGANNAGKSTVVEGLRLVALSVARFSGGAGFGPIPDWLDHPEAYRGITPVARTLEGADQSMLYLYGGPPALIKARFSSGATVLVFVGPEGQLHSVCRDRNGSAVGSAAEAKRLGLTPISIQPQVAPLLRDEKSLQRRTVQRGDGTYLAPLHFRNQLRYFGEHFPEFQRLVEET
jgi:AAA ATPase-like protein